jgi:hypothetical protein
VLLEFLEEDVERESIFGNNEHSTRISINTMYKCWFKKPLPRRGSQIILYELDN